jgi:O-antigen/teichoic acid export membrane protein
MEPQAFLPAAQPARLRTDVFVTFGGKAATLLFGLLTAVVIARQLGPSGQGTFAVAYSLVLLLVQVGSLGIASANPYFVAREPRLLPRIVGNSLWLTSGLAVLLVAAGAAIKLIAPGLLEGLGWTPLIVTLAGIPGALAAYFLQSALLGAGRMIAYNAVEAGQAALTLAAVAVGFTAFNFDLTAALAAIGIGRYAAALAYLVLLGGPRRQQLGFDSKLARQTLAYGSRVYVAIVLSYLIVRFDLLLVNTYLGKHEAGLYSVAATLADGMFVIPMVVSLNLFPRVARGDPTKASAEVFRSVAVLYGLLCLATVPIAGPGIRMFFGDSFSGATSLYYWLLPGIYAYGMLTILSGHFAGRGFPRSAIVVWILGMSLNVVLNVVFLPGRGAWVASLTSSISYCVLLGLHMWLFAREAGGFDSMRPRAREVVRFVRFAFTRGSS